MEKKGKYYIKIATPLTKEQIHEFNSDFITRYAEPLSEGIDMIAVWERELSCLETGIVPFEIGNEYSLNGRFTVKILSQIEEHSFGVLVTDNMYNDEYVEECEIFHDDQSEYIMVNAGGKRIQVKPI